MLATLAFEATLAQPSNRHAHYHKRSLRDVLEKRWGTPPGGFDNPSIYNDVDWDKVLKGTSGNSKQGQSDQPTTTTPTSSPSETGGQSGSTSTSTSQSSSPSSSAGSSSSSSSDSHSDGGSSSCSDLQDFNWEKPHRKRAEGFQDNYVGNTGGAVYGSNIHAERNCKPSLDHSLTFVNNLGSEKKFWIWNKIGSDKHSMSGMMADRKQFSLQNGQKATFSLEPNSQLGFSLAVGQADTNGGVPNGNIGELNIDDQLSKGGSFYDVSLVTLNDIKKAGGHPIEYPLKISAPGWNDSSNSKCVYTDSSQNSPVNPGGDGKCACGPTDGRSFHVTAVFG